MSLRKRCWRGCNLHTVLDCPGGTFQGAGVKTVVLFFTKGEPTQTIWFYQLDPGCNMGKTNPLNDADLAEFCGPASQPGRLAQKLARGRGEPEQRNLRRSVKNPNGGEVVALRSPAEIRMRLRRWTRRGDEVLAVIRGLV